MKSVAIFGGTGGLGKQLSEKLNANPQKTPLTKNILSKWKNKLDKSLSSKLNQLNNCIESQDDYGNLISGLIKNLSIEDIDTKQEKEKDAPQDNSSKAENNKLTFRSVSIKSFSKALGKTDL